MSRTLPENGYYYTEQDLPEYQNDFEHRHKNVMAKCGDCAAQCFGCKSNTIPTVTFIVTENCNLNCSYCYEKHKTCAKMSEQIASDAVDFLFSDKMSPYFNLDEIGGFIVEFIGGEPWLAPEIVDLVATKFKEMAYDKKPAWLQNSMFNMTTNGTLYFEKATQRVLAKHGSKMSMSITIDGDKKLHDTCRVFHNGKGSYDVVVEAIRDWNTKSHNRNTNTKVTIAPENVMYIFDAFKHLWEEIGVHFLASNCVFENVWKPEDAQILYDELIRVADYLIDNDLYDKYYTSFFEEQIGQPEINFDKNACGGTGAMLAIGTDGKLYPCMRYMNFSLAHREEKCIGDIYNGINMDDPWLQSLKAITIETQSTEECLNCPIAGGCNLCSAWQYDIFGDANIRATFICDTHKARVCANDYYWNKLYKKLGLDKEFVLNIENTFMKR